MNKIRGIDQRRWCDKVIKTKYNCTNKDYISMWIADSDLPLPNEIVDIIVERAKYPFYGYQTLREEFLKGLRNYYAQKNVKYTDEEVFFTPGTVFSASTALQASTKIGEKILVSTPIYNPLWNMINDCKRNIVNVPLIKNRDKFDLDFVNLKKAAESKKPAAMVICSPLNPSGRVWNKDEMNKIVELCKNNNMTLIVDEIHLDITLFDNEAISFATLTNQYDKIVVVASINKTYNIAGIQNGWAICKNKELMQEMHNILEMFHISPEPNIFAQSSAIACFEHGKKYFDESKKVYEDNVNSVIDIFSKNKSKFKPIKPQATFLMYVSYEDFGITEDTMRRAMCDEVGVVCQFGSEFADPDSRFFRFNLAVSREMAIEAANRLIKLEKTL